MPLNNSRDALLIGAGNIGALYDLDSNPNEVSRTHLSALTKCKKIEWVDVIEPNPITIQRIKKNPKVRYCYASLRELEAHCSEYRIACVATPSDTHFSMLKSLDKSSISIGHVLCEKPLFSEFSEFKTQVSEVRTMKFPVTVNYSRTWSLGNINLLDNAARHDLGAFTSGIASYGKGLKNNGSHMINLLMQVFDGVPEISYVSKLSVDGNNGDQTISFGLLINHSDVTVIATSSSSFSMFEIDLRFEHGRLLLKDGGHTIEHYLPRPDPNYLGYHSLEKSFSEKTDLSEALEKAIDAVVSTSESLNFEQAVMTATTYFKIESEHNQIERGSVYV